jgi:protein-S-isoprenylcysteine O-methyltransferase Ste14
MDRHRTRLLPRSAREVAALACLVLLAWILVTFALAGLASWSGPDILRMGVVGAAVILAGALAAAWRIAAADRRPPPR